MREELPSVEDLQEVVLKLRVDAEDPGGRVSSERQLRSWLFSGRGLGQFGNGLLPNCNSVESAGEVLMSQLEAAAARTALQGDVR